MTFHDIIDLVFMALFMATPFIPFAILFRSHKQKHAEK